MYSRLRCHYLFLTLVSLAFVSCQSSKVFNDEEGYEYSLKNLVELGNELVMRAHQLHASTSTIDQRFQNLRTALVAKEQQLSIDLKGIDGAKSLANLQVSQYLNSYRVLLALTNTLETIVNSIKLNKVFFVVSPEAFTNAHIGPNEVPVGFCAAEITLSQSAGEYTSSELAIYALKDTGNLTLETTEFEGPQKLPIEIVDISFLTSWYQAGKEVYEPLPFISKRLVNEILVKDDSLVRVDETTQSNFLKVFDENRVERYLPISGPVTKFEPRDRVEDKKNIGAFSIKNAQNKLIWLTVHIPENAPAGDYVSEIRVMRDGSQVDSIKIKLKVNPFTLSASPLEYSLYYRGVLTNNETISSDYKTEIQYRAELEDMKAHGITNPTVYQDFDDFLPKVLEIRRALGMNLGPFYGVGNGVGEIKNAQNYVDLANKIQKWKSLVTGFGFSELYLYGLEELLGEKLKQQKEAWAFTQSQGAKVFTATFPGSFSAIGDILDLSVQAFKPNPVDAVKYHNRGNKIYAYSYPQVGNEEALTYRKNYGLELYLAGYDGEMNYAYQHGFGNVWNDFDGWPWRDHNFTYPTSDKPILTKQWEGFREAVYDVRYIETLKALIRKSPLNAGPWYVAASKYLDSLDITTDLDYMRDRIIFYISKLIK